MSLETNAVDQLVQEISQRHEDELRTALETNPWSVFPILDYVIARDVVPKVGSEDGRFTLEHETVVRRYESPAPPVAESAIEGNTCSIQRWTKPLYDRMREEHPDVFAVGGQGFSGKWETVAERGLR